MSPALRWTAIWGAMALLMIWNTTADTYLERWVSVFLVAWLAAFEAVTRR